MKYDRVFSKLADIGSATRHLKVQPHSVQELTKVGTEAMPLMTTAPELSKNSTDYHLHLDNLPPLSATKLLEIYHLMLKTRLLEERLIYMPKQHHGFFWIGGPGEEAFNIPLGLQIKKGKGLNYDYLHLHYRSTGVLIAMGLDPTGPIRQMKSTASDPFSGGRNFASHYSIPEWNIIPVTSTIETQYLTAIGTAIAQRTPGNSAITIVNGGDAGTAEGDFASCLIWASRPKQELPILMIVANNGWGISTPAATQHGEKTIADRGKAFGIKTGVIDGNDAELSYLAIQQAMNYVRTERKPFLLEAKVSRLYGHSSASGANFNHLEEDPLANLEQKLEARQLITKPEIDQLRKDYEHEYRLLVEKVIHEPQPNSNSIYDFTYWQQTGKYW